MYREVQRLIDRALARLRLPYRVRIGRVKSNGRIQSVDADGIENEDLPDLEHFHQFGMTSVPPEGATGIAIPLGGKTSHSVVVATEHETYRIRALKSGEIAIYSSEGACVKILQGRVIEADCDVYRVNCQVYEVNAGEKVDLNTPVTTMSDRAVVQKQLTGHGGMALDTTQAGSEGPVARIAGTIEATVDVVGGGISLKTHDHATGVGAPT